MSTCAPINMRKGPHQSDLKMLAKEGWVYIPLLLQMRFSITGCHKAYTNDLAGAKDANWDQSTIFTSHHMGHTTDVHYEQYQSRENVKNTSAGSASVFQHVIGEGITLHVFSNAQIPVAFNCEGFFRKLVKPNVDPLSSHAGTAGRNSILQKHGPPLKRMDISEKFLGVGCEKSFSLYGGDLILHMVKHCPSISWKCDKCATGLLPTRWQQGTDVMLQKKKGNFRVGKLRTIILLEADFNNNNKLLGCEMMASGELFMALAKEQYGSGKRKTSQEAALNK